MADKKILLIDGDGYFLHLYGEMLSALNYEVITASDGERGLFLVNDKKPDIVVSEIKLERQSGFDLLKDLKSKEQTENIPVVILANSGERGDIKEALSLGATEYLIKAHHTPTEVVDVILQILKK